MALSIVILVISAVLLLGFSLRSRYGLPLFLLNAGISITSVAVLFQTSSTSMYATPQGFPLRSLDLELFQLISHMRLPLAQAQTLRNFGTLIFFGGIVLMLMLIARNIKIIRHLAVVVVPKHPHGLADIPCLAVSQPAGLHDFHRSLHAVL